ncbi:hypothetical protein [Streptomyces sp. G-G2]|uniref:hypothetical protein n=1 Tax=Streptomyces sp. G-G2 TaxID=3046201 RepID=UPI0024B9B38F|nr:hypothetical protein [Streptomyces sp. G-G2]MDJ0384173.1 hypothetical protein [Streptomyces sp. G-G2]
MISEPEADVGWTTELADSSGPPPAGPPPAPERKEGGRPGRAGGLLWGLGGAALASALWAGGLYALGDRPDAPPMAYQLPAKMCDALEAKALSAAVGDLTKSAPVDQKSERPVQDWAVCGKDTGADGALRYNVWATVALHKKTDPGPEFDIRNPWLRGETGPDPTAVPELGERALMRSAYGATGPELRVLDGGAVFTLSVWVMDVAKGSGAPAGTIDYAPIEAALIADMRDMMAAMKKK